MYRCLVVLGLFLLISCKDEISYRDMLKAELEYDIQQLYLENENTEIYLKAVHEATPYKQPSLLENVNLISERIDTIISQSNKIMQIVEYKQYFRNLDFENDVFKLMLQDLQKTRNFDDLELLKLYKNIQILSIYKEFLQQYEYPHHTEEMFEQYEYLKQKFEGDN